MRTYRTLRQAVARSRATEQEGRAGAGWTRLRLEESAPASAADRVVPPDLRRAA
jgi:cell division protein FtsL